MKKSIITLTTLAALATSSLCGLVFGPAYANSVTNAPCAVQVESTKSKASQVDFLAEVDNYMEAEDFAGLLAFCEASIAENPQQPEPYFYRAWSRYQLQQATDLVRADLNTAITLNPQYVDALMARALLAEFGNEFESSLDDFDRILSIEPNNMAALEGRMSVHEFLHDWIGLVNDCTYWISIAPEDPNAYYVRAMVQVEMGNVEGAISDLEQTSDLLIAQDLTNESEEVDALIAHLKSDEKELG